MSQIRERGSTHVYKVNKISKEEMDEMTRLHAGRLRRRLQKGAAAL